MNSPMTPEEMKNRYVYQVGRFLPPKSRPEIEKEIRSLIDDMLEARCQGADPTEEDMKAVLAELGRPSELAAKYNDSKMYLIGPAYFPLYVRTLIIFEAIVGIGVLVSIVTSLIMRTFEPSDVFSIVSAALGVLGVVTLAFFLIERQGMKLDDLFEAEAYLPPVPEAKAKISRSEPIVTMIFATIFLVLIVGFPQVFGFWDAEAGRMITIFNLDVVHASAYLFVIGFLCEIARSVAELFEGRYTLRLLAVTIPTRIINLAATLYFMTSQIVWNPNLPAELVLRFPDAMQQIAFAEVAQVFTTTIIVIAVFGTVVDLISITSKSILYGRKDYSIKGK